MTGLAPRSAENTAGYAGGEPTFYSQIPCGIDKAVGRSTKSDSENGPKAYTCRDTPTRDGYRQGYTEDHNACYCAQKSTYQ